MGEIAAGIPKIPGEDAPEGFTKNYVAVFKGFFLNTPVIRVRTISTIRRSS
jgi:hypothetical protein